MISFYFKECINKRFSTSVLRDMQIEIIMIYHHMHIRIKTKQKHKYP